MGCCGDREKQEYLRTEQKWDYINLDDFKSSSCWAFIAYGYLWIMLFVSVSVYAVDTFTCINLIAFDKWSGQIKPAIPFNIARWIFAGCILLSFLLLVYRWWRAVRVMKQGGVAKSYLDPLAVRVQSIRMGKEGRGWKRFLVFAELTKSRKGADYVALFSYFSFEAWLRIVFAEGPRQVINGITIYSVMRASLIPEGVHAATDGTSPFVQFWLNVGILADQDKLQAAILLGMVWTVLIWVFAAISLAMSVILYLIFLWHHIPSQDGGLASYCRRKINRRMERVVKVKVDKARKKEDEIRVRQEATAARDGLSLKKQPTLPNIAAFDKDSMASLSRQNTTTTLPEYESRPGSTRNSHETIPAMPAPYGGEQRPELKRHATQTSNASWTSYNSNAPLMSTTSDMGHSLADNAQTPGSTVSAPWSARPIPSRSATGVSQFSDQSFTPGSRSFTPHSQRYGPGTYQMEPLPRPGTSMSSASRGQRRQPSDSDDSTSYYHQTPSSAHPLSAGANGSYFPPIHESELSGRSSPFVEPPVRSYTPHGPPTDRSFTASVPPPRSFTPNGMPYDRSFTSSVPPPRSFTPQGPPPPDRSFTPVGNPHPPTRMPTSNSVASKEYMPYNPRAAVPMPTQQNQEYRSFSRPLGPGQRNGDVNRDSGFDDILSHY